MDEKAIARLWKRLARMYGHRWVSAYGEKDDGTWAKGLAGLTADQLGVGLRSCLLRTDAWPPSLPEFRAICIAKPAVENAGMYRTYRALPKPPPNREKALEQLVIMRRATGCPRS